MKILKYSFLISIISFLVSCESKQGNALADFNLKTIDGKDISNSDLKDKTVVINVWGTWCGPCVSELPHLNQLVDKYKNDDSVVFLALAKEDEKTISRFLTRRPFNYIQVPNAESLTDELHIGVVDEIPLHIIVNKEGIITFEMTGATQDIVEILSIEIEKTKNL